MAVSVLNHQNVVVAQEGLRLTRPVLEKLERLGHRRLFIEEHGFEDIETREAFAPQTYAGLRHFLLELAGAAQASGQVAVPDRALAGWVAMMCDDVGQSGDSFLLYPAEDDERERWLARTLNNAALGIAAMRRIGGLDAARHMAAAALLQDLGCWCLPPAQRTQAFAFDTSSPEWIDAHVEASLQLIRGNALSPFVKAIIGQHHERHDGSGRPQGKKGEEIHPLARIMAVIDTYTALVQARQDTLLPHEALEWIMAGAGFEFEHTAVKVFRNAIRPYPVGSEVQLDSGEWGVVIDASGARDTRPRIRLLFDREGKRIHPPQEIDLSKEMTRTIVKIA